MLEAKTILKASVEAGRELLRPPGAAASAAAAAADPAVADAASAPPGASRRSSGRQRAAKPAPSAPALVPIRALGARHRHHVLRHLLSLNAHDRYLRFGYAASDEHVQRYVQSLDFSRDEVFGVYNRRLELIAVGHLALAQQAPDVPVPPGEQPTPADPLALAVDAANLTLGQPPAARQSEGTPTAHVGACAELGMSVRSQDRGVGLGKGLFERAAMLARNHGVRMLFIQALSENDAMLAIARKAGARVETVGAETEAYLLLEEPDLDSRLTEVVEEQVAEADYLMKAQAKQFWDLLTQLMAARKALFHWPGT